MNQIVKEFILPIQTVDLIQTDYTLFWITTMVFFFKTTLLLLWHVYKVKKLQQQLDEVIKMDELKNKTMECIESLEKDMVDRIKHAQDTGEGIDLMSRNAKVMELLRKLDIAFIEAKARVPKKKGGLFGR